MPDEYVAKLVYRRTDGQSVQSTTYWHSVASNDPDIDWGDPANRILMYDPQYLMGTMLSAFTPSQVWFLNTLVEVYQLPNFNRVARQWYVPKFGPLPPYGLVFGAPHYQEFAFVVDWYPQTGFKTRQWLGFCPTEYVNGVDGVNALGLFALNVALGLVSGGCRVVSPRNKTCLPVLSTNLHTSLVTNNKRRLETTYRPDDPINP